MDLRFEALSCLSRYLEILVKDRPRIRVERVKVIKDLIYDHFRRRAPDVAGVADIYQRLENLDILTQWDEYERVILMYGDVYDVNAMWLEVLKDLVYP